MMPGHLEALVATDRQFFGAGAAKAAIGPSTLSWMPGLVHVAAGCVVHSVDVPAIVDPPDWLDAIEEAVQVREAPLIRIYLDANEDPEHGAPLHALLEQRGYTPRTEHAVVATCRPPPPIPSLALERLDARDDGDWRTFEAVQQASGIGSGIYTATPDEWTDLWRRKCATSVMDAHLIAHDGVPCGTVGILTVGPVLRAKNLLVERSFRRRAIGRSVLSLLWAAARDLRCTAVGAFVVDDTDGRALLAAADFEDAGTQVEWSRAAR